VSESRGREGSAIGAEIQAFSRRLVENVERVIVGKREVVELATVSLLCEGHVLFEDVPGVGKTMLARALAVTLGLTFRRIQFTPDLLPNDVTGVSVYNQKASEFEFRPGPAFAHVLLADEINRATPRTQSALLECMGERQISVDGVSRVLPRPFIVLATQNPIEYEGTFPLPEAQLDRFLLRLRIGYPTLEDERQIVANIRQTHPIDRLGQAVESEELLALQQKVTEVYVEDSVRDYALRIVRATREHADVALGASPRGSLGLYRAAQAYAGLQGRDFVLPDDVKRLAPVALAHRLIIRPESQLRGRSADAILEAILHTVEPPLAR
jgi:MoxR-like ATPase